MHASSTSSTKMDLGDLGEHWDQVARDLQAVTQLPSLAAARLLSARAFDESQPAGLRTYMAANRYLGVARDNHEALLALLQHHGATLWAPWSLLRPTFETAFLAAWILDPEDGRERRTRGLRCEVVDFYAQRNHRETFSAFPEAQALIEQGNREAESGSLATYRSEAAALGQPFEKVHQKINVVDELQKLTFTRRDRRAGALLVATWRLLSGFEHGLGWALLSGTDRKIQTEIPGGMEVHLEINDERFVLVAKTTCLMLRAACGLFRRRHMDPVQQ